ncbi:ankyrin repeat domain-containing protein 12-like isoform X3 [Mercenaria mercenaria]|uniref:ankyrin repeat domain-containing protein 12-like isoform X3 n=1 Tax=Mercenaria mercenaria TaxID=6596 RepID=UPI00234EDE14|nr:ankyrin repeat domain-containing protein 12-like isoform X3 [Mercenaria mercenaria]
MNEEIPRGNFEESVPSDAGRADDIPKVSLSPSTTDESRFNLENTKIYFTRHGIRIIDRGDNTKTTLLHAAAGFGDIESVRYLLEQNVDVNITDERGLTPLHNGVHHNHYAIAELLVEQGASVNREDVWGFTPLHLAAEVKDWNIYQLLLKNGGDGNKKNRNGDTPNDLFLKQIKSFDVLQRKQTKATNLHKKSLKQENSIDGTNDSQGSDQLAGMQPCPSVILDTETSRTPEVPPSLVGIMGTNLQQAGINRDPPFKSRGVIVGNEQSVTEDFTRVGQHSINPSGKSASSCHQANIPTQILEFTSAQLPLANMIEKSDTLSQRSDVSKSTSGYSSLLSQTDAPLRQDEVGNKRKAIDQDTLGGILFQKQQTEKRQRLHRGSASIQSFSRHFSDTLMNKPFASPMSPRPAFNTSQFRSPFSNESSHLRTSHHESSLYPGKTKFGGNSSVSFRSQRNVDLSQSLLSPVKAKPRSNFNKEAVTSSTAKRIFEALDKIPTSPSGAMTVPPFLSRNSTRSFTKNGPPTQKLNISQVPGETISRATRLDTDVLNSEARTPADEMRVNLYNRDNASARSAVEDNTVHLQTENQGSADTVVRPKDLLESPENLEATEIPEAAGESTTEKGRKRVKVRNMSKRHHSKIQDKSKIKKAAILTSRRKGHLQKNLEKSFQGNEKSTQFRGKTNQERMQTVLHLKKGADSDWKIVKPVVNDGFHKPPKTSTCSTSYIPEALHVFEQDTGESQSAELGSKEGDIPACMQSDTSDGIVNVVSVANSNQLSFGAYTEPGTSMTALVEPVSEQKHNTKCRYGTTEQAEEGCIPFADHSSPKSVSERQQKIAVLRNEFRNTPKEQHKLLFSNFKSVLAQANHTSHPELPDQHSDQKAQPVPSHSLADVESNNLQHEIEMVSQLPNFDAIGLEEERVNNSGTSIKNTVYEYLTKKESNG